MFLRPNLLEFDSHTILPELQFSSNHASLVVDIYITGEFVQDKRCTIIKNSKEEEKFISELVKAIKKIDIFQLVDKESLELTV